jgi:hypothetical protein
MSSVKLAGKVIIGEEGGVNEILYVAYIQQLNV